MTDETKQMSETPVFTVIGTSAPAATTAPDTAPEEHPAPVESALAELSARLMAGGGFAAAEVEARRAVLDGVFVRMTKEPNSPTSTPQRRQEQGLSMEQVLERARTAARAHASTIGDGAP